MRHRTWSYNEISRRYTDIDMQFYEPNLFRTQHKSNRQASNPEDLINPIVTYVKTPHGASSTADNLVKLHNERSLHLFNALISSGVCREQARGEHRQHILHLLRADKGGRRQYVRGARCAGMEDGGEMGERV